MIARMGPSRRDNRQPSGGVRGFWFGSLFEGALFSSILKNSLHQGSDRAEGVGATTFAYLDSDLASHGVAVLQGVCQGQGQGQGWCEAQSFPICTRAEDTLSVKVRFQGGDHSVCGKANGKRQKGKSGRRSVGRQSDPLRRSSANF